MRRSCKKSRGVLGSSYYKLSRIFKLISHTFEDLSYSLPSAYLEDYMKSKKNIKTHSPASKGFHLFAKHYTLKYNRSEGLEQIWADELDGKTRERYEDLANDRTEISKL